MTGEISDLEAALANAKNDSAQKVTIIIKLLHDVINLKKETTFRTS